MYAPKAAVAMYALHPKLNVSNAFPSSRLEVCFVPQLMEGSPVISQASPISLWEMPALEA